MLKAWTHGTRMSQNQCLELGKRQTPVELNDSAGPTTLESMEISLLRTHLETTSDETSTPVIHPVMPPVTPSKLEPSTPVRTPVIPRQLKVNLGFIGINNDPDQAKPPEVYRKINGHPACIMLDTGCSTYVLSSDFAKSCSIPSFPSKRIPVELAI